MKKAILALALIAAAVPAMARPVFHPNLGCVNGVHLVFIGGWPRWMPC
jgi:hypothetical protein